MALVKHLAEGQPSSSYTLEKFKRGDWIIRAGAGTPKYSVDGGSTWLWCSSTNENTLHLKDCVLWVAYIAGTDDIVVTQLPQNCMYVSDIT